MDREALRRLGDERIDWRYKGLPARYEGMTVAQVIADRPAATELTTPLLVLDGAALTHNLDTMAAYCARAGVDLAPHGKTTMAPQLFARQLDAGAWGITAATVAHLRAYRAYGVATIVLGNQLIDPDGLAHVAAELRRDPEFRLLCFADSIEGVTLMQRALADADAPRPVDIVIDVGAAGGRTGVRNDREALAVARAVRESDRLRLAGVGGFEGALAPDRSEASLAHVRGYLTGLRALATLLDAEGLFDAVDEIIVTAGGSAYFDDVVAILTGGWDTGRPVRTVLRSGAYVTHDDGHYRELTPLRDDDGAERFRPALRLLGRVLSIPEPGLALLDFGKRDAPYDLGLPEPHTVRSPGGPERDLVGASISALADQHAFLRTDTAQLSIGDVVSCGVSHPCTAFDKWRLIPVLEDGHLVDLIRTFF